LRIRLLYSTDRKVIGFLCAVTSLWFAFPHLNPASDWPCFGGGSSVLAGSFNSGAATGSGWRSHPPLAALACDGQIASPANMLVVIMSSLPRVNRGDGKGMESRCRGFPSYACATRSG
jgi:heme/copper-type cytochrome/quinol oxidase subunit 1